VSKAWRSPTEASVVDQVRIERGIVSQTRGVRTSFMTGKKREGINFFTRKERIRDRTGAKPRTLQMAESEWFPAEPGRKGGSRRRGRRHAFKKNRGEGLVTFQATSPRKANVTNSNGEVGGNKDARRLPKEIAQQTVVSQGFPHLKKKEGRRIGMSDRRGVSNLALQHR